VNIPRVNAELEVGGVLVYGVQPARGWGTRGRSRPRVGLRPTRG